jgi:dihydropteroate synthase
MQSNPTYQDIVAEVRDFFVDRLRRLAEAGVRAEQVLLVPGFGFGKTADHNLELLARVAEFRSLARPLLLGISRKSFISRVLGGADESQRLAGGLAGSVWAAAQGVQVFRTHDVAATTQALRMLEAIRSHPQ